jgi:hypothetical protein
MRRFTTNHANPPCRWNFAVAVTFTKALSPAS